MILILVPAYNPDNNFLTLIQALLQHNVTLVVVDDGSDNPNSQEILKHLSPKVVLLHHKINMGKGAALKTGLNYIALQYPQALGVVTADADGQHAVKDILHIASAQTNHPDKLVLGVRTFDVKNIPFRSRFGNTLTRVIFNFLTGLSLKDTQTGLRSIPLSHIPTYLTITSNHYEFELDMLLCAKNHHTGIVQIPIQSIYINNNQGSHFNPLLDSIRIYFVLLRFLLSSLTAALLDYVVFMVIYGTTHQLLLSQYTARLISGSFNYITNKKGVFATQKHPPNPKDHTLLKYIALAIALGFCAYLIIQFLMTLHIPVWLAKPLAEGLLFIASFSIQRSFVFVYKK